LQAVDGVAYIMSRHAGGDAEFSGLFRDIEQKAGLTGRPRHLDGVRTAAE